MSLSSSNAKQKNSCYVDSTQLPNLDVKGTVRYVHLNGFHARRMILFKIRIYIRNIMRYWIRY